MTSQLELLQPGLNESNAIHTGSPISNYNWRGTLRGTLLDRLSDDFRQVFAHMSYSGTLEELLNETASLLDANKISGSADARLAMHAPRIIRAAVDYKITHPKDSEAFNLVRSAIDVALGIYKQDQDSANKLREFREKILYSNPQLLSTEVRQPEDKVTWTATMPSRSDKTAANLAERLSGQDVVFIALGHGGVAAGMDVYLKYCERTGSTGSSFYVARFSSQKQGDKTPKLTVKEIDYLRRISLGKTLVVFDEDTCTGSTLRKAALYFSRAFPEQSVITLANLDGKKELLGSLPEPNESLDNLLEQLPHYELKSLLNSHIIDNYFKKGLRINNQDSGTGLKRLTKKIPIDNYLVRLLTDSLNSREKRYKPIIPNYLQAACTAAK